MVNIVDAVRFVDLNIFCPSSCESDYTSFFMKAVISSAGKYHNNWVCSNKGHDKKCIKISSKRGLTSLQRTKGWVPSVFIIMEVSLLWNEVSPDCIGDSTRF